MKSSAATEELQASFRLIGRGLVRAEAIYFWFGNLGKFCEETEAPPTVYDFLKQELLGIKTGDLELYFEDLTGRKECREPLPEELALPCPDEVPGAMKLFRILWSAKRRRRMFAEAIEREIRRRHGESDDGGTPIPTGYPLRVSYRS